MDEILAQQLQNALAECERLRTENTQLRTLLNQTPDTIETQTHVSENVIAPQSAQEKIVLFRSLFRGREDTYPVRWETKDGRVGYSPALGNQWNKCQCKKPKIRCAICNKEKLLPVIDQVIYDHLSGKQMIGVYPLMIDETCWFLAVDFDKTDWQADALAFQKAAKKFSVPVYLERSQSGNGAHAWLFFQEAVPAYLARQLGCGLLTQTMQARHQLSLNSYDRLFPNQDTMPKGGFGNLIALPLQGSRRKLNNNIFLDENMQPYADQWAFLSTIKKINYAQLLTTVNLLSDGYDVIDARKSQTDETEETDPWISSSSKETTKINITDSLPALINITLANLVYVDITNSPSALINQIKKLAAFQNPEFYKAQAMRLSTYGKPRVIGCAEMFPKHVGLPRGCLEGVKNLLTQYGIKIDIKDESYIGEKIDVTFSGQLHTNQKEAVKELLKHNYGVLAATTAFGKTVTAIWMLAKRQVNTLILVHRQQLLDQWRERLSLFLNIPIKEIGSIGGGKKHITEKIDVAMIQSLFRDHEVNNLVTNYGHVIVDECHHISAFSFEQVMKHIKARYVLGLTATPIRKDGHHPIILMQCGNIHYRSAARNKSGQNQVAYLVKVRHTQFSLSLNQEKIAIQDLYAALAIDEIRNQLIFDDILLALEEGRSPLVLTERTQHLEWFANKLKNFAKNIIVLKGGMSKKQRESTIEQLKSIPDNEERIILATGKYIGEGFDDARLDTLFLTLPISWQGTLQQYVGRLHRTHHAKSDVQVYDYVDSNVVMLKRMYEKRFKKYRSIGYTIEN